MGSIAGLDAQDGAADIASVSGIPSRLFATASVPSLSEFAKLCRQSTDQHAYPKCEAVIANIPVYNLAKYSVEDSQSTTALQDEWYHILHRGAGVVILRNFEQDHALLHTVNKIYDEIIATEEGSKTIKGDHFAASGKNSRIWNSFAKHARADSSSFLKYYSNPWLSLVSSTWLGPHYQITAQVNIVRPQGKPQQPHRDYHLGFQIADACAQYPKHMQIASQFLTLQGAIAHSDMPLQSGPTRFLPFSQNFEEGYLAYRLPGFAEYFEQNWISAPLQLGDAVFFNPALFHAAGENVSQGINRSANLLQISSAFGKTMENINTVAIIENCFEDLVSMVKQESSVDGRRARCAIAAVASGYPFPTNLDRRPPAPGEMAPESQAKVLTRCLRDGLNKEQTIGEIRKAEENSKDV